MSVGAVIGLQWGDEGKGKVIDYLSQRADIVVRATGGNNTGRTVVNEYGKIALHLIPAGIFNPNTTCVIGHGVVVDIKSLLSEIQSVRELGISITPERLLVSSRAHLVMPWHIWLDQAEEAKRKGKKLGTTLRGIGPCFTDKISRVSLRVGDILKPDFKERFLYAFETKRRLLNSTFYGETIQRDFAYGKRIPKERGEELWNEFQENAAFLKPFIVDAASFLWEQLETKGDPAILLEGSQGVLLDPDFGVDYPFVTSSPVTVAGLSQGSGIPPTRIDEVIGIVKAYTTRVAAGPFPTEMTPGETAFLKERGLEYGATTGRPRRCGWLDLPLLKYAARINGVDTIALTKIDILGLFEKVKLATGYSDGSKFFSCKDYLSVDSLERLEPLYRIFEGWGEVPSLSQFSFTDLPSDAQRYIEFIETTLGIPIAIISFGEERQKLLFT